MNSAGQSPSLTEQSAPLAGLPKAELHLHLEGSIRPRTVVELAAHHGVTLAEEEAERRYRYADFHGFLQAFKWITSFLRRPEHYALLTERLADELLAQNVVYAEVIVAVGVMLWRKQDAEANFRAIAEAGAKARARGLHLQWIPDGTWQFGPAAALEVARLAAQWKGSGVVAFGMGGDELALPFEQFRPAYEFAAAAGLHRTAHAGEVGSPQAIRDAVELLGAERIGHGLAAMHDPALMDSLCDRSITLEVCPTSNLSTGALAHQLGKAEANLTEHPLPVFFDRGLPLALSTDDPAMFDTDLITEYARCLLVGLSPQQIARLTEMSFEAAFLPDAQKASLIAAFRAKRAALGLV
jgi:adenosine deaminase